MLLVYNYQTSGRTRPSERFKYINGYDNKDSDVHKTFIVAIFHC